MMDVRLAAALAIAMTNPVQGDLGMFDSMLPRPRVSDWKHSEDRVSKAEAKRQRKNEARLRREGSRDQG